MTKTSLIVSSGTIRVARCLSEEGTVVVFQGQLVDPTTPIAFRKVWSKHFSVDASHALEIASSDSPREFLTIAEGDFISIGEQIALRDGKRKRTLIAARSGRFLGIASNRLIFETDPFDIESSIAGFPGVVTDIFPNRGAMLEAEGSSVQAIWGNGKIGQGILLSIDMKKDHGIFSRDSISMDLAGTVMFANTCVDPDALKEAAKMHPGGLIFGSLPASMLPIASRMKFPILVTDRIGLGRISDPVHLALGENIIKFAYLHGGAMSGGQPAKPEIIIPKDEYIPAKPNPIKLLKIGAQVRILDGFYGGELGMIIEILPADNLMEKEAPVDQVKICIDEETVVILPVTNVEVISQK